MCSLYGGLSKDPIDLDLIYKILQILFYISYSIKQNKKNLWDGSTVEFSFQC